MYDYELEWATKYGTSWYRSKERKAGGTLPFGSFMMNKKWTMVEEFTRHMMWFQQVSRSFIYFSQQQFTFQAGLTTIEAHFKEFQENDEPEPLRTEHFYLSIGLWLIGILLSVFCFIVEIAIHRIRKCKTNVPSERLVEPAVPHSTPELEDGHNSDVEDNEDAKVQTHLN